MKENPQLELKQEGEIDEGSWGRLLNALSCFRQPSQVSATWHSINDLCRLCDPRSRGVCLYRFSISFQTGGSWKPPDKQTYAFRFATVKKKVELVKLPYFAVKSPQFFSVQRGPLPVSKPWSPLARRRFKVNPPCRVSLKNVPLNSATTKRCARR